MDLAHVLAADLRDLAVDLAANAYTRETLVMLQSDLRRQVPSALGATITVTDDAVPGCPVAINLVGSPVEPTAVAAALLVPLEKLAAPTSGRVVLLAGAAGAFDALAVTLAAALDVPAGSLDRHPALPRTTIRPGITGLKDFSVVNRALGVLINRGHTLPAARAELLARADRSRLDLPTAAQLLLDSLHWPVRS